MSKLITGADNHYPAPIPHSVSPAGGVSSKGSPSANLYEVDPSYDVASPTQTQVAPRADMKSPWYINNLGPSSLYYGPSGAGTTGTVVTAGSKSASISSDVANSISIFAVCAPGSTATFHVTNF